MRHAEETRAAEEIRNEERNPLQREAQRKAEESKIKGLFSFDFFDLANKDLISLASFAQSVFLQLSSLFRTFELCVVK